MEKTNPSTVSRLGQPVAVQNVLFAAIWVGSGLVIWFLARFGDPGVDPGALLVFAVAGGAILAGLLTPNLTRAGR